MPFNWSDWVNGKKSEAGQHKYVFCISLEVKPSFEHWIPFFSIIQIIEKSQYGNVIVFMYI